MKNASVAINHSTILPMAEQKAEIVERKGIGHPDTMSDSISEAVSQAICAYSLKEFGMVLHHNTDEAHIVGGRSEPRFGGGIVTDPIRVVLVGRASLKVNGEPVPIPEIALGAAKKRLKKFKTLDIEEQCVFDHYIKGGSEDLRANHEGSGTCNDTSFGVGFAPFSSTEELTLGLEEAITGTFRDQGQDSLGYDVKVMSVRKGKELDITIACAMVDSKLKDGREYAHAIEQLHASALNYCEAKHGIVPRIFINTADRPAEDVRYLTVTGLSCECGDDGSTGRGNRVSGLITPCRYMSMEAAAGKNPTTHIGKIYNVLARRIASAIVKDANDAVQEAHVRLVSQIGRPIDEPQLVTVDLVARDEASYRSGRGFAESVVEDQLGHIDAVVKDLIAGRERLF